MHAIIAIVAASAILFLLPGQAHAWGPGVHLAVGNALLADLGLIAPFLAELLSAHKNAFLYGCLSADIFIGKGTEVKPGHSHNWETGFRLLETVRDPRSMAYAYGYISHLAADTVAHNLFVPNLLAIAPSGGTMSHVYVEMLADRKADWDKAQATDLLSRSFPGADDLLRRAMGASKLPFLFKKQLFFSGVFLTRSLGWNESLGLATRVLPSMEFDDYFREMYALTMRTVLSVFDDPLTSPALDLDPIGSENLRRIRRTRRSTGRRLRTPRLGELFPVPPLLASLPSPARRAPLQAGLAHIAA